MPDTDKIRFLTGRQADLSLQPVVRGQVYFAINGEDGQIVFDAPIDASTTRRIVMGSFVNATDKANKDSAGNEFISTYPFKFTITSTGTSFQINALAFNGDAVSGSPISIAVADATHAGIITNAAQDITGLKTFKTGITIDAAGGFEYSGIQTNATNSARSIWFSDPAAAGKPTINANFTYNPSTKTLVAENITGTASRAIADSAGNEFISKYPYSFELNNAKTSIIVKAQNADTLFTLSPAFLPTAGGTMTGNITFNDANIGIKRVGRSVNWNKGRDGALLKSTSISGYSPLISIKTNNGSWDIGAYTDSGWLDDLLFTYITDTDYNGTNKTTAQIRFLENGHIVADLNGTATKAQQDSAGNEFISKYPFLFQETTSTTTYKINIKAPNGDTIQVKNTSGTLVNELTVPGATTSVAGLVTTGAQTWSGIKTLQNAGEAGIEVENTNSGASNKLAFLNGLSSGYSGMYSRKHSKWVAYIDLSGNSYFKGTADLTDAVNANPATGDNEFTHAWFSYGTTGNNEKKRAYDNSYKYNSGTHTLNVTQYRINDHGLISYDANTESIVFSFV